MNKRRLMLFAVAVMATLTVRLGAGAQDSASDTERALTDGLRPLKSVEICPPVFDGAFGVDPAVPAQSVLMDAAQAKLKAAGIAFSLQPKHRETFVDKTVLRDRKTIGWMHIKVQVIAIPERKSYAFRIVLQVQSPVAHPGDPKTYVFANLYEDSVLLVATAERAPDAVTNGMSEIFDRFCGRWAAAHKKE